MNLPTWFRTIAFTSTFWNFKNIALSTLSLKHSISGASYLNLPWFVLPRWLCKMEKALSKASIGGLFLFSYRRRFRLPHKLQAMQLSLARSFSCWTTSIKLACYEHVAMHERYSFKAGRISEQFQRAWDALSLGLWQNQHLFSTFMCFLSRFWRVKKHSRRALHIKICILWGTSFFTIFSRERTN